jgi:hypothetical protein
MYRHMKTFVLGAALSAFAGALVTSAQNSRAIANVPFAFQTQGPVLDAGQVMVKEVNGQGVYQIMDHTGESTFWSASAKVAADPQKPHLTFACYAHNCVLAEIAMPGSNSALRLSEAAINRQLPRKIGVASMIYAALR